MSEVLHKIRAHINQLAPHVRVRRSSELLIEAAEEIERQANRDTNAVTLVEQPFGTGEWAGTWSGFPAIALSYYGGAPLLYFDGEWKKKTFPCISDLRKCIEAEV